jgi:hypothetical protein
VPVGSSEEKAVSGNRKEMTFFQMLRDVLVASLNRGQFPMAIMGLIVIIAVCRMPPADYRMGHSEQAAAARDGGGNQAFE